MFLVFGYHDYKNGYFYRMRYGSHTGIDTSTLKEDFNYLNHDPDRNRLFYLNSEASSRSAPFGPGSPGNSSTSIQRLSFSFFLL
jgi:hypothetical protein